MSHMSTIGIRRLQRVTPPSLPAPGMTAIALALAMSFQAHGTVARAADDEQEEDVIVGSVGTSIPDSEARAKDQEAANRGFSLLTGVTAFLAADDNVYRSPEDLEQSGMLWGNLLLVEADKRWPRAGRLVTNLVWNHTRHPQYSNVNSSYGRISNTYQRSLGGGLRLECDLGLSHNSDDAATIEGEDYERDYAYWRLGGEASLRWRLSSHHLLWVTAGGVHKDYAETPDLNSIDWGEWSGTAQYRLRLAPYHYLTLLYSTSTRNYAEEPAATSTGSELPGNPAERHRYRTLGATYARVLWRSSFQAHYDLSTKTDLFAGYESSRTHTVSFQAGRTFGRMETRLGLEESWHDYQEMRGDGGQRLEYSGWQAELGGRLRVVDHAWIFCSLTYYGRDSNKSTGTSYRDYEGLVPSFGTGVYF